MPKFLKSGKQAQFPLPEGPLTVRMEDEIIHTVAFPVCDDPDCICYRDQYEQIAQETCTKPRRRSRRVIRGTYETHDEYDAPLNGNRPFSLLK